jgi:predicted nucleic acid-binding protein
VIVLDSSLLVAWTNERDVHHPAAADFMRRFLEGEWEEGLLLEYVFLEVVTVIQARLDHVSAVAVGDHLLRARELVFVPGSDVFLPAVELFRSQGDLGLSFADAAIVAVARRSAGGQVAAFDRAFQRVEGISVHPEDASGR